MSSSTVAPFALATPRWDTSWSVNRNVTVPVGRFPMAGGYGTYGELPSVPTTDLGTEAAGLAGTTPSTRAMPIRGTRASQHRGAFGIDAGHVGVESCPRWAPKPASGRRIMSPPPAGLESVRPR